MSQAKCEYADDLHNKAEKKLLVDARQCSITGKHCWNWSKPEAVKTCTVRKVFGAAKQGGE